jgi:hypothetical protein
LVTFLNFIFGIYLVKARPFKLSRDFAKTLSGEVLVFLVELSVFLLAGDDNLNYLSDESRLFIGWVIITEISAVVLI